MAISNKLKIKVRVGDRYYPMTIDRDDEQRIRTAADSVTEMYKRFGTKILDPSDRMAFVAFEMAMRLNKSEVSEQSKLFEQQIDKMCEQIDSVLESQG